MKDKASGIEYKAWDVVRLKGRTDTYRVRSYRGMLIFAGEHSDTTTNPDRDTVESVVDQSDCVVMPRALTAENGAKALLIHEFSEQVRVPCVYCGGDGVEVDDCEECNSDGEMQVAAYVSWTTIKAIYAKAVEHFTEEKS